METTTMHRRRGCKQEETFKLIGRGGENVGKILVPGREAGEDRFHGGGGGGGEAGN